MPTVQKSNSYQDGDGNTVPSAWKKWNADIALGFTQMKTRGSNSLVENLMVNRFMLDVQWTDLSLRVKA